MDVSKARFRFYRGVVLVDEQVGVSIIMSSRIKPDPTEDGDMVSELRYSSGTTMMDERFSGKM